mgnify:FL=1
MERRVDEYVHVDVDGRSRLGRAECERQGTTEGMREVGLIAIVVEPHDPLGESETPSRRERGGHRRRGGGSGTPREVTDQIGELLEGAAPGLVIDLRMDLRLGNVGVPRSAADKIWRLVAISGTRHVSEFRGRLGWIALRLGGCWAYRSHAERRRAREAGSGAPSPG